MEIGSLQPAVSGIIGAIIATLLASYCSRSLPRSYSSRPHDCLLKEHRAAIRVANALCFGGICFGIGLYPPE
jgi:hypothetical protein